MWLVTPPNPDGPGYHNYGWHAEFLEYGIATGTVSGHYSATPVFFWARYYFSSGGHAYYYNEYTAPGTPYFGADYTIKINWAGGSAYWQIYRNGVYQYTGIQSQQPPGSYQAVEGGAEMSGTTSDDEGLVTDPRYNLGNGTTYGWNGYSYYDPTVYTTFSATNTSLNFDTGC